MTPGAGVTVSKTSVDSFGVNGNTKNFSLKDQTSIIAYAGAILQGTVPVSDSLILLPFVSANVYNDFGQSTKATLDLGQTVNVKTENVGTFGQVGGGLTFFVPTGSGNAPYMVGGVRADTQFGSRLKGWTVTGNVRLEF